MDYYILLYEQQISPDFTDQVEQQLMKNHRLSHITSDEFVREMRAHARGNKIDNLTSE